MTIQYETAEHMVQLLTYALTKMNGLRMDDERLHDNVDKLFTEYCDLMRIDGIEEPDDLEAVMRIFFADTEVAD